jgi:hypothetical protein
MRVADAVVAELGRVAPLRSALVDDAWTFRLRYAVAFHALADAACRISDAKERSWTGSRGPASVELCLGLWLVGTLLLERLVAARERGGSADEAPSLAWDEPRRERCRAAGTRQ